MTASTEPNPGPPLFLYDCTNKYKQKWKSPTLNSTHHVDTNRAFLKIFSLPLQIQTYNIKLHVHCASCKEKRKYKEYILIIIYYMSVRHKSMLRIHISTKRNLLPPCERGWLENVLFSSLLSYISHLYYPLPSAPLESNRYQLAMPRLSRGV